MVYSVDRIEGELAVLVDENEAVCHVALTELPLHTKEGDMLRLVDGHYVADDASAKARREQVLRLQDKLRRR